MSELKLEHLSVGYHRKALLEDICLKLHEGEIIALIGPNGAGKSTVLKTLTGELEALSGTVLLGEEELLKMKQMDRAKKMSIMLTKRQETQYMTVRDFVSVGRFPFTGMLGTLSEADWKAVDSCMKEVHVYELKDREYITLSDGQKQRVMLARALVQEPGILILDEPTSYLDIGYKLQFAKLLRRIAKEKKIGVFMAMHEIELVRNTADTIVTVSKDGKVEQIGEPKELLTAEYLEGLFGIEKGELSKVYSFASDEKKEPQMDVQRRKEHIDKKTAFDTQEKQKTRFIMVQGTMSGAGKSLLAAGLCRIFMQDGYRVAPFKSQNMALNSYVTEDGLEMGRAQVMQAEAAGVEPSVYMNPILLKPTDDCGSQVIVNGKVVGNMRAREYFRYKTSLIPDILSAVEKLEEQADIIVIEGAGSPAEVNLKENDIVNMGMAKLVDAPVLLVGDIDRGGVFAQLLGTLELLTTEERARVKGLVVNKFRGDPSLLDSGLDILKEKGRTEIAGVVPYIQLQLEDEDSLTEKFDQRTVGNVNIGIVRLPHISNFSDFNTFEQLHEVGVGYIKKASDVTRYDVIILPGSKNTIADLRWMKESGIAEKVIDAAKNEKIVFGICGGYQMLGDTIEDPYGVEVGGKEDGLGLLPVRTKLQNGKHRKRTVGSIPVETGIFSPWNGVSFSGYEIHMGETTPGSGCEVEEFTTNQSGFCLGTVAGTYIHGFFDEKEVLEGFLRIVSNQTGVEFKETSLQSYRNVKELEYDRLADMLREHMNMEYIYQVMGLEGKRNE